MTLPPSFYLNTNQIIFIVIVVGFFGTIFGQKFYKDYRKKQEKKAHWKAKRTKK